MCARLFCLKESVHSGEMSDHTACDDAVNSLKSGSDCLSDERSTNSSENDWSPPQRKVPSHKRNLIYTHSPGSDCPSVSRKRQLNCITSSGNDYTYLFERLKTDAEVSVSNSLVENSRPCDSALKSSNNCDQMLRQIIRTAYQFTRHSHRQKLTVKDLEKAFKIHRIDMKPDDYSFIDMNDIDSIESGDESQPVTCSGMWLKKP
ncbi:hypothetical protein AVEN_213839-1 [Araneus ventricosus]|uniref:TATA box binding protein associated factor (TAF) histone-like fold domain-containing protein n=1 Tax=Araneus ventricosus TaxID=182803 RepID=A0A4Y2JYX1_ARAVE|nr:hypothetical protein AVEN_213839-1 [Araneus ventricosus]